MVSMHRTLSSSINRALTGSTLAVLSLWAAGSAPLQAQTAPPADAAGPEARYLSNIRQITTRDMGFHNAGEAYFSPDGKDIIFQATPIGQTDYQIYTMNLKGGEPRMVSTGKGACTCAYYRPDGKKIIFASSHLDPDLDKPKETSPKKGYEWDFNAHMDIFEADPDGANLKRLTDAPGYDAEGSYSADGRFIVFTSQRDGDLEIYVMNADGSDQRRITHGKGYDGGPFFSPDGRSILYRGDRRNDGKQNLQIRLVGADASHDRALTDNELFNWCPFWHPSGKSFIFTQADHSLRARGEKPNYDLYLMKVPQGDTAKPAPTPESMVRITTDPAFDGLPVFSPDGRMLMWTSRRGGLEHPQVFIADFRLPEDFH